MVPLTSPEKLIADTDPELQTIISVTSFTDGVGFTVMLKVFAVPLHPVASGVTVIVAITGVVPVFIALNVEIFPVPLADSPIDGVLLVQE